MFMYNEFKSRYLFGSAFSEILFVDRGLFFAPIYPPISGGAAIHFQQICSELVKRDVIEQAVIITRYSKSMPLIESNDGKFIFRCLIPPDLVHKGNTYIRLGFNLSVVLFFVLLYIGILRAQTVHMHTKPEYRWGCSAAKRLGAKVIIDGRDPWAPDFPVEGDVFVAASRNIQSIASNRSEEVKYIPIGIEPDNFSDIKPSCPIQSRYFLFVGEIAEHKGVGVLLQTYESNEFDYPLYLIGRGKDEYLVNKANNMENTHYEGEKTHQQTIHFIDNAELVILPSREEALGRVVLECIMVGTPVICPPLPEYKKHIPEYVVDDITPKSIAQKIPQLVQRTADDSNYPIERHYKHNVIDSYIEIYL